MMTTRTLLLLAAQCLLLYSPAVLAQNRTARPMTEEFFNSMLFTVVGSSQVIPQDADTNTASFYLENWTVQTEWNWNYARELAVNESKMFPFIICDDANIPTLARREKIVQEAIGVETDEDSNLNDYISTIYNIPNITCVTGMIDGTWAETLGQFIVQPIGFIMKLNSGSLDFVSDESKAREFAINICPGLPWLNLTSFVLDTLQATIPMIDFLLTVPEIGPFAPDLIELQQELETDPLYCNDPLVNNLEAVQEGVDYVILRLTTPEEGFAPEACFLLLALGLAHAPEICFIERREPFIVENTVAQWIGQSGVPDDTPFSDAGITGKGQVVAVSDSGLDLKSCYFRDSESLGPFEFGEMVQPSRRKVIQYVNYVDESDYENGHGTHVCGTIAGRKSEDGINETDGFVDGIAFDAKLAFFDIGRTSKRFRIPGASTLLDPGKAAGARIHSASWGSKSTFYTTQDRDFDRYIYDDDRFLVIVAAGNRGPSERTVGSPANAKNIITVGASTSAEGDISPDVTPVDALAGFSSTGPAMDGRFKPDLVAPGSYVISAGARPYEACDPPTEAELPGPGDRDSPYGVLSLQGTSMATPVVSGFAALTHQYFEEGWYGDGSKGSAEGMIVSGTLIKAILINGAQPLAGYAFDAVDEKQGFGRLSLIDSLPLEGENDLNGEFYDNETVAEGGYNEFEITLDSANLTCSDPDFSVTLVWPDPPGYVSCLQCVLNDLDLQVEKTSLDGGSTLHYPNGRDRKDSTNNVERVRVKASPGDSLRVTVTAAHLESSDQKYALAWVHGCLNNRARTVSTSSASAITLTIAGALVVIVAFCGLLDWL